MVEIRTRVPAREPLRRHPPTRVTLGASPARERAQRQPHEHLARPRCQDDPACQPGWHMARSKPRPRPRRYGQWHMARSTGISGGHSSSPARATSAGRRRRPEPGAVNRHVGRGPLARRAPTLGDRPALTVAARTARGAALSAWSGREERNPRARGGPVPTGCRTHAQQWGRRGWCRPVPPAARAASRPTRPHG